VKLMPRSLVRPVAAAAPRALAWAVLIAAACFVLAGVAEALLIRLVSPTELELDWISDGVLSVALGAAIYLWLHLRATRLALTARERTQLVLQAQLSLAEAMQRRLLPPVPEPAGGLEWAAVLVPAGRIGGDFFDFLQPSPGVRLMLIADVSGKGIPAAMALTLLRATFRSVATHATRPEAIAERMSAALYDEWQGEPYVTALIVRVDVTSRRLTYTNAGHPRGILCRDRSRRALTEGGPPLGLLNDVAFEEEALDLEPGDLCVFVKRTVCPRPSTSWIGRGMRRSAMRSRTAEHPAPMPCAAPFLRSRRTAEARSTATTGVTIVPSSCSTLARRSIPDEPLLMCASSPAQSRRAR